MGKMVYHPKYSIFFDMHTQQACPETARSFDPEAFAEKLAASHIDLCGFHAKCNQGFCYFNTQTGIRHPSMPEGSDLFGSVVEACRKRNIKVSAYLNCGLSNEDAIRHPEWSRVGLAGNLLHPEVYDIGWTTPYMRTMCPNSPWRDYLMNLIREVRDQYDVAGFLFDSFNVFPCICPHCIKGMKAAGMDYTKESDIMAFAEKSVLRLAEDISALLSPRENGLLTYFLGIKSADNARIGSYLECECLPTNPVWGYDYLPLFARYFRNIAPAGSPVLNMTGRFNNWGDFGSLRPAEAIEYDIFFGLANGMRPNIGDHLHPSGKLFDSVFDRVGGVYKKAAKYDPWYEDAVNVTELAVVIQNDMSKTPALVGVTRLLSELKIQFDFIDSRCDWSKYQLLILPDDIVIDETLGSLVKAHLAAGKKIISTGRSGLDPEGKAFVFEKEWGCRHIGKCEYQPAYFKLNGKYASEMPDLPLAVPVTGEKVQAAVPETVAGNIVRSYYNKGWDGVYSVFYAPPAVETDQPFLILGEQCACCTIPLCESYYRQSTPDLRKVMEIMIRHFLPEFCFAADRKLPGFARVFVTEKPGLRMVHLLNYLPELRGENLMIEDALPLTGVTGSLKLGGKKVRSVRLAPENTPVPFEVTGDRVKFTVPESNGYALIAVELE